MLEPLHKQVCIQPISDTDIINMQIRTLTRSLGMCETTIHENKVLLIVIPLIAHVHHRDVYLMSAFTSARCILVCLLICYTSVGRFLASVSAVTLSKSIIQKYLTKNTYTYNKYTSCKVKHYILQINCFYMRDEFLYISCF